MRYGTTYHLYIFWIYYRPCRIGYTTFVIISFSRGIIKYTFILLSYELFIS
nr:MAG TPA: hypothetical protein [Caudoviricetes sp.]